jgi:rhodanese-related sulfurtransferase
MAVSIKMILFESDQLKNRPIVTCCASGARSASAKRILKSHGFEQVYNGGSWYTLRKYTS